MQADVLLHPQQDAVISIPLKRTQIVRIFLNKLRQPLKFARNDPAVVQ